MAFQHRAEDGGLVLMEQPHGIAHMGAHRGAQTDGAHGLVIGCSGMADAHHDAQLPQGGNHVLHPLQLGGNGDVIDFAAGQFLVMANQGNVVFLEKMLRHGALVLLGQEGAFQVDAHQLRAVLLHFFMALELPDAPLGLLPGIRQDGALPGGGSFGGHEAADFFQILRRGSIHIHPHRAVGVGIDKAGNQLQPCGIEYGALLCGAARFQNLELSVLHADCCRAKAVFQIGLTVYKIDLTHIIASVFQIRHELRHANQGIGMLRQHGNRECGSHLPIAAAAGNGPVPIPEDAQAN